MLNNKKLKANIILLLSAYIPLYLTIIVQNSFSLWDKLNLKYKIAFLDFLDSKKIKNNLDEVFSYPEAWITTFFITFILFLFGLIYFMLRNTYSTSSSLSYEVKVVDVEDKNHEYLTSYIAVYILPFITLNLTTYSGLAQFIILFLFIGYIYLKYEMIYINPILNIFFRLNAYDVHYEIEENDKTYNTVLLSKKDKDVLTKGKIKVKGSNGILIDLTKNSKIK
ncbi:hypothetical protein JCM9140_4457 [Halalkalibacter wakoensis JCM 9140]|uniref:Uncharacterized protein n=1 Tax=Halalkalibacter wakoensis JCM 9140 TaxID=1236970 RepID=W4QA23_9BACI|nr:hypothetical protein [Halalkalibacter wakoensis]GAE28244.1 hypothetical protein JCM9140_4457 [Halalkalibacter wakoensis JCM 9140]